MTEPQNPQPSSQTTPRPPLEKIEFAAGGVVWTSDRDRPRLAVVHRKEHGDWTLPKGRPQPDEEPETTALREAMEETGYVVLPGKLAGCYRYLKNGEPKLVLIWHLTKQEESYGRPAPKDEVDEVRWLTPDRAIIQLTHLAEREFVERHCRRVPGSVCGGATAGDPRLDRLAARIQSSREQFECSCRRPAGPTGRWWVASAGCSLDLAEAALDRREVDLGWSAVHDAERFMIFGMNDTELIDRAVSLQAETEVKLKGWRLAVTKALFAPLGLPDWLKTGRLGKNPGDPDAKDPGIEYDRIRLQQAVFESLGVMNEDSDNVYHRMRQVGKQLNYLVAACGTLVGAALLGAGFLAAPGSKLGWDYLAPVALAGALGAVFSAMYQLSRVGEAKIPAALLHGLITSGRPLVGAASALFIYGAMQSNLISLIDASKISLEAGLVLGFVAGVSEQFVLSTVAKVTGAREETAGTGEPPGNGGKDRPDQGEGPKPAPKPDGKGNPPPGAAERRPEKPPGVSDKPAEKPTQPAPVIAEPAATPKPEQPPHR